MNNLNKEIGSRLRLIRSIFNEGGKLSAEQFAYLLNQNTDKILNYELGRAAVPLELLISLYERGYNPVFILTGKEGIFCNNSEGKKRKKELEQRGVNIQNVISQNVVSINNLQDSSTKLPIISVAAGKIKSKPKKENHHRPED